MSDSEDSDRVPGLERLRVDRLPEQDLWPGIDARLRRRPLDRYGWALAASVVAGLAAVLATQRPPPAAPAVAAAVPARASAAAPALSPDSRAIVKANLQMVDHARRELRAALVADPESAVARSLLQSTQRRYDELQRLL